MNALKKLVGAFEQNQISAEVGQWDFLEEWAVPGYRKLIADLPPDLRTEGDGKIDQGIYGLIQILNLLGVKTVSSCSGHNKTKPFVLVKIESVADLRVIHEVLTGDELGVLFTGDAKLSTFRVWADKLETLGLRIDFPFDELELDDFAASLMFTALQAHFGVVNLEWPLTNLMEAVGKASTK